MPGKLSSGAWRSTLTEAANRWTASASRARGAAAHVADVRRRRAHRAGGRPALGPDGAAAARDRRRLPAAARRRPVLLLFIIAGLIALLLNPFVTLLQRRARPARRRGGDRDGRAGRVARRRSASCSPTRSPTRSSASSATCPGYVDDANASLADLQDWLDRNGIDVQVKRGGRDRAADDRRAHHRRARASVVSFTRDALQTLVEAALALILIIVLGGLHADLRRPHRRGGARRRAARRRHAGRRLPDARAGVAVRLRARPAAVQPDHGHERGPDAVRPRLARDLPRGQDVRDRVRRLVRLRGADPVRRPGDRRASRRW